MICFFRQFIKVFLVFSLLTGCSNSGDSSSKDASEDESSAVVEDNDSNVDDNEETSTLESTYDYTVKMDVTNVDFTALSALSNSDIPYGFNYSDRDEQNRPNGVYYYDNHLRYSEYNCYTHIETDEKTIYLTFDAGYENGYTAIILDTLKEKGVQAVFFVTKSFCETEPELVQRMIDEGHIIGNHTCSHPSSGMPSLGLEAEYEDIKTLNDYVYDNFGYQMRLFRFPKGMASEQAVALLDQMGYNSVFWSFAYVDYNTSDQKDPTETLSLCLENLHPGAIYLLHAVSSTNATILGDFIDNSREQGFDFSVFPVEF